MSTHGTTSEIDIQAVRPDFPILQQTMRGHPLVYLDSGATALKPTCVVDAEVEYLTQVSANIHRGVYEYSERATLAYDRVREQVAAFINAPEDGSVVFTKGTTESVNLVAYSWARERLGPGDEVVVSELDHHANLVPWQETARATGATLRFLPLDAEGRVIVERLDEVIGPKTRLLAITGMSNVTGYVPPLAALINAAHAVGAVVLVDGAQLVSHRPTNMAAMDADFLCFSGHKMCGPTGVGVLYAKRRLLEEMPPFLYGGDMVTRVRRESATYKPVPEKFEAGTPNIAGVLGLGAAISYLEEIGMARIEEHENALLRYILSRAAEEPGIVSYGPEGVEERGAIFSFNVGEVHPHDVGAVLDSHGVAVRTGLLCAHPLMTHFGIHGTVRASCHLYNTTADIDRLFEAVAAAREMFS